MTLRIQLASLPVGNAASMFPYQRIMHFWAKGMQMREIMLHSHSYNIDLVQRSIALREPGGKLHPDLRRQYSGRP